MIESTGDIPDYGTPEKPKPSWDGFISFPKVSSSDPDAAILQGSQLWPQDNVGDGGTAGLVRIARAETPVVVDAGGGMLTRRLRQLSIASYAVLGSGFVALSTYELFGDGAQKLHGNLYATSLALLGLGLLMRAFSRGVGGRAPRKAGKVQKVEEVKPISVKPADVVEIDDRQII